ncbi:MAG: transglycosylase SLT domain-containing protein [Flavobacteriaceae bacterium]
MRFILTILCLFMISCGSEKTDNDVDTKDLDSQDLVQEQKVIEKLKPRDLDQIIDSGVLRVVIQNSPTSYFVYKGAPMGYEYDMVSRLANYFNLELDIQVVDDIDTGMQLVEKGHSDILAYNLTITQDRKDRIEFSRPIYQINQVLVQKKPENWRSVPMHVTEKKLIRNVTDLGEKEVYVIKNSSHQDRLENLSNEIGSEIYIKPVGGSTVMEELLDWVYSGKIKYAVVDSNVANMYASVYKDLDAKTSVSFEQNIAWGLHKNSKKWKDTLNYGISYFKKKPEMNILYKRYFGNNRLVRSQVKNFSNTDHISSISQYDDYLKKYSQDLDWDWRYLAALIYTESKFDHNLESWAGAQGLMQLMPVTAKAYGVQDSFDPEQNIKAGIQHLDWLEEYWKSKLPEDVDVKPYILASYNAGQGHVNDAISLTQYLGKDPNHWEDVSDHLEMLSNPEYYNLDLIKHGYCRGSEPVSYVKKINKTYSRYVDLIEK